MQASDRKKAKQKMVHSVIKPQVNYKIFRHWRRVYSIIASAITCQARLLRGIIMIISDIAKVTSPLSLEAIRQLVATDFTQLNAIITQSLQSEVPLIQQVSQHIISGGGKRLRPMLTLLCAKAYDYEGDVHVMLAAIVEFLHTATLLHDDVVDKSELRRGQPTANKIWGSQASVLVGDFIYSRTFQLMTRLQNLTIMQILADATNIIAQGEVLQLINRHNPDITETHYLEVIRCKTAVLFAAATQVGAAITSCSPAQLQAIADYGLHLGMAFQMLDDCLDYCASQTSLGKNLGDDLAEGKLTLPLIYALQQCNAEQAQLIRNAIVQGGLTDFNAIMQIISSTDAFTYAKQRAQHQADLAKAALHSMPNNPYKEALLALAQLAVDRNS